MEIGTKPMVEDFQRSVVIERDVKGRQWRANRRTLIWGVTQFRKTLIEEGNSKSGGTVFLVRGCLVLVDGIGWAGGRFLVPQPVDGGALKWSGLTTKFRLCGVACRPGDGRRLLLICCFLNRVCQYWWIILWATDNSRLWGSTWVISYSEKVNNSITPQHFSSLIIHLMYSSKSVRFRLGHLKPLSEIGSELGDLPLDVAADDKFKWTYTSPEFPMMQDSRLQQFVLPETVLWVEGYLQVELLGRVQKQETDGLFYMCVNHVQALGRLLYPAFDMEAIEPYGFKKLVLKHVPEDLAPFLESTPNHDILHLRHLQDVAVSHQINWDVLVRGFERGANVNAFLDSDDDDLDEMNDRFAF
ncbi:hypothetical protein CASFOL_015900 [Castilleja foliolosa]|uniref:Uncharacterized protein n=1 Tax=Castilleja foliolosa TaxID=1961234 RepID=A0ABD3DFZ2_9LAMI